MMDRIIEEAAYSASANACRLSLKIERLAYHPAFPEETRIEPCSSGSQRLSECGNHRHEEAFVGGYALSASESLRELAEISADNVVEIQLGRAAFRASPG